MQNIRKIKRTKTIQRIRKIHEDIVRQIRKKGTNCSSSVPRKTSKKVCFGGESVDSTNTAGVHLMFGSRGLF